MPSVAEFGSDQVDRPRQNAIAISFLARSSASSNSVSWSAVASATSDESATPMSRAGTRRFCAQLAEQLRGDLRMTRSEITGASSVRLAERS